MQFYFGGTAVVLLKWKNDSYSQKYVNTIKVKISLLSLKNKKNVELKYFLEVIPVKMPGIKITATHVRFGEEESGFGCELLLPPATQ